MEFLVTALATAHRLVSAEPLGSLCFVLGIGLAVRFLSRDPRSNRSGGAGLTRAGREHALCSEPHEYGPVRVQDFHGLDEGLYDRAQRESEDAGLRCLGDVENLSVSAVFPRLRTAIRDFASDDGEVADSVWQVRAGRWFRIRRPGIRAMELVTEFSDGTFLSTTNHPGPEHGANVRGIERIQTPYPTPAGQMVAAHRAGIARVMERKCGVVPVPVQTHRELRRSAERAHALRREADVRSPAGAVWGTPCGVRECDFARGMDVNRRMQHANHAAGSAG